MLHSRIMENWLNMSCNLVCFFSCSVATWCCHGFFSRHGEIEHQLHKQVLVDESGPVFSNFRARMGLEKEGSVATTLPSFHGPNSVP